MKFTEGYWVRSEHADAVFASHAYDIQPIPGGLRVVAPAQWIASRGATLNTATITLEFTSPAENIISVRNYHYEAFESGEARFEKSNDPQPVEITMTEDFALMQVGRVAVRIFRKTWGYQFEGDGRVITSCGFRNLGYIRYDKEISSVLPGDQYLIENAKPHMVTELSLQPGECVYGLGERFTAFVKNGQVVETWNEDGGTSSQIAYKSIPFYMTNKGYGILVDHADNVSFEVASEKVEYVGFSVPGEELRYDFIYGPTPKEILKAYTGLTGRPALPPAWSFGLWLSTSFTTNYDEATTSSFIDGMLERDIPLSVFHFDCFWMKEFHWCDFEWDERVFPDVEGMLARYKAKGLKLNVWINPYIAQGNDFFREGAKKGYFLMRKDGKGVKQIDWWQAGMALVDFTNPDACKWYSDKLKTLLDMGIDAFKTDFGERIPVDVTYFNGAEPNSMHNYYTYLYNKCVFDLLVRERGEGEAVLFARSATAGCQQFPVHWGGDCSASYPSMAETLRGGLSFAMSGFSFWSHDISGFEQTAPPDVYKRWVAFGMLSTHSRLHGSSSYRVPWLFDEESNLVVKHFTNMKCRLMPYIFQMSVQAKEEGTPVLRPMVFDYPQDPATAYLDMQYMFGDSLLVAPIFNPDSRADYYLPEGLWTDYLTGEVKEGGRWFTGTYDYFSLPLYVKPNTLLAVGAREDKPDYDFVDGVTLNVYQLADGAQAPCSVPKMDGSRALNVTAARADGRITFTFDGAIGAVKIRLVGITKVQAVEGGSMIGEEGGVLIGVDAANLVVTL